MLPPAALQTYLDNIYTNNTYQEWQTLYTPTNVEDRQRIEKYSFFWRLELKAKTVPPAQREGQPEEKVEIISVLDGLRKYAANHVLLVGKPGAGKSTTLEYLLWEEAQNLLKQQDGNRKIPVLIKLRRFETSVLNLIRNFLQKYGLPLETDAIETLLNKGKFLLLLDGLNELPNEVARKDLISFRERYQSLIPMIFTTRDISLGGSFGIDKQLQMQSLTEPQMQEFVKAYLPEQGEAMLKRLGDKLRQFGETPLLLWMLCRVYAIEGGKIPNNLGEVFQEFAHLYDNEIKYDVPIEDQFRRWQSELLQHLAFAMMQREKTTELRLKLPIIEAEEILTQFLNRKKIVSNTDDKAKCWLEELLKHHLINKVDNTTLEFRHQLLQEYYAAEYLLRQLSKLTNEQLKSHYLNYLKWTESLALLLGLILEEKKAIRIVQLALEVDWQLGARLAGEVRKEFQVKTVQLIFDINLPQLLKFKLLGLTRSDVAIPDLIQALEHSNNSVRRSAADVLGDIGSEVAIPALVQALKPSDDVCSNTTNARSNIGLEISDNDVRRSAANALGKIGSETVIPALLQALENSDTFVNCDAVETLGKIGSEAAIFALIQALKHFNEDVRFVAAEVLGDMGSEAAIPALLQALEDSSGSVRYNAVEALGKIGSKMAIPALLQALENPDDHIRNILENPNVDNSYFLENFDLYICQIAETLSKIGLKEIIYVLIDALENSDVEVRFNRVKVLSNIGSKAVVPGLIKALEDAEDFIRSYAAEALGNIGAEVAIPALIQALEDSSDEVRKYAVKALGNIGAEVAIPALIQALKDINYYVRSCAAVALDKIGFKAAIPTLIQDLKNSDRYVRWGATEALGKIGTVNVLWQLKQSFKNPEFLLIRNSDTALKALKTISKIQESDACKFYNPELLMNMNPSEIFISYAWRDESEEITNQLETAFRARGIPIIRDKKELGYKGLIREFMQRIGKGKAIIIVISDRYLKSENCMFELLEISKNGDFYDRIFPLVLSDAKIYKATDRLDYCQYWEQELKELQDKMKQGDLTFLIGITDDLNLYAEIRNNLSNLTNILKNINTLTPQIHQQSGFDELIQAVENRLKADSLATDETQPH